MNKIKQADKIYSNIKKESNESIEDLIKELIDEIENLQNTQQEYWEGHYDEPGHKEKLKEVIGDIVDANWELRQLIK